MQFCVSKIGINIHAQKTKFLIAGFFPNEKPPIVPAGKVLEEVDCFKYLGSIMTTTDQEEEVNNCIQSARFTFWHLRSWLCSRIEIKIGIKIHICHCSCLHPSTVIPDWWEQATYENLVFNLYCLFHYCLLATVHLKSRCLFLLQHILSTTRSLMRRLHWFNHALFIIQITSSTKPLIQHLLRVGKNNAEASWKWTWLRTVNQDAELYEVQRWNWDWLTLVSMSTWLSSRDAVNSLGGTGQ